MMDSTALDRERRLLAALAQPRADGCVAEDALLVDNRGVQRWRDAPPAGVPGSQIDGLSTLAVTEQAILVTYRLMAEDGTAAHCCSTLWQRGPRGWVAALHHRSPLPPGAADGPPRSAQGHARQRRDTEAAARSRPLGDARAEFASGLLVSGKRRTDALRRC